MGIEKRKQYATNMIQHTQGKLFHFSYYLLKEFVVENGIYRERRIRVFQTKFSFQLKPLSPQFIRMENCGKKNNKKRQ